MCSRLKPPSLKQIKEAKELRYKEERMVEVIYDIGAYLMYICILVFLATGNRDVNAYGQNEVLKVSNEAQFIILVTFQ